jgi:hypothetical protein
VSDLRSLVISGVVAVLVLGGCAAFFNPASESVVSVRGRVANVDPASECDLRLHGANGKMLQEIVTTAVFERSLVIAPGAQEYYLEISCADQPGRFRTPVRRLGGGTRLLDLGVIALECDAGFRELSQQQDARKINPRSRHGVLGAGP